MQIAADNPDHYIKQLPEERRPAMTKLRKTLLKHLPEGFVETMSYSMIGYVVPHNLYPAGYHVDPSLPLPFISIASQKNFVALYHMGMYADRGLMEWFTSEYPIHCSTRLDMGKSCIRFKKIDQIPYDLIGALATKMTVADCIRIYEAAMKARK